jgi:hypothetical protein
MIHDADGLGQPLRTASPVIAIDATNDYDFYGDVIHLFVGSTGTAKIGLVNLARHRSWANRLTPRGAIWMSRLHHRPMDNVFDDSKQ